MVANGQRGSPDLRNKFIPAAGDSYSPGDAGGAILNSHDFTGVGHAHNIPGTTNITYGPSYLAALGLVSAAGTTDERNTLPPYKSLFYIFHKGRRNYHVA